MLDKKICIVCHEPYSPMTRKQQYCSPGCRKVNETKIRQAEWANRKPRPRQVNGFREFELGPRVFMN